MSLQTFKKALEKAARPAGYFRDFTLGTKTKRIDCDLWSQEQSDIADELLQSGTPPSLLKKISTKVAFNYSEKTGHIMDSFVQEDSITSTPKYDAENDTYKTIYSKRGISADFDYLTKFSISQLFNKVWLQDDFGLVTIYTSFNELPIKFVVELTNLGFNVRAWVNQNPCSLLDGYVSNVDSITTLFDKFEKA